MAEDPDLTGRVTLDLTGLVSGLRFAQAVTRRQIGILVRDANTRLRGLDTDPLRRGLARIGGMIGSLGRLAAPFAAAGAAIGGLVPLVAGLVSTLANVAPAAALAVSGVLAIGLASTTLKIAMSGVGDAVKAALDPSDPEAYAAALKKLAPNARSFVEEIHKASPALDAIKKSVQDKVFAGLDKQLASTAKTTLPAFRTALDSTASTLNHMATGVFTAVRTLGKDGTLGTALKGATAGLNEFSRAPGQVVTALGQIGAAAAPAFARLSKAGGGALDRLAEKLTKSFESGGMQAAIEQAITLIGQLGRVLGNVGSVFGAVFGAAQTSGGGMLGVLESITSEIARIAKTDAVQNALKALFSVMSTLGKTAAPLLGQALQAIAPVFTALGPPVQLLIKALGAALSPVIKALGPVLVAAATAVGSLVTAFAPLLTVAGQLIAAVLPVLTPLLDALNTVFVALAPVIQQVGDNLKDTLTPILAVLPSIIAPLADVLAAQLVAGLQLFGDLLTALSPSLVTLGEALGELLVALTPLIEAWALMSTELITVLMPVLEPLIKIVGELAGFLADDLARTITDVVVPALQMFAAILHGDVNGAIDAAKRTLSGLVSTAVARFTELPEKTAAALTPMAVKLRGKINEAGAAMASAIVTKRAELLQNIAEIPDRARAALGDLRNYLVSAGVSLVAGFIAGIQSKIPSVQGVLSSLTNKIPDWKGPKKRDATLLTPAGKTIIKGLIDGLTAGAGALQKRLSTITSLIQRAVSIDARNRNGKSALGPLLTMVERDNRRLLVLAKQRDTIATKLKTAQANLDSILNQRSDLAAKIRDGILGSVDVTIGNSLVNSVSAITLGLQQAALQSKKFQINLGKLKNAGLNTTILNDIASAGFEGGGATAAALANATPDEIKKINELQGSIVRSATGSGTIVAGAMYDAGVKAAQGLITGLKQQKGAIERAMETIATAIVKALTKKLDIHSPSRVARRIGVQFMEGMPIGFEAMRAKVTASAASVAGAAARAASTVATVSSSIPAPGQLTAAYAGTAGAGPTTNNFYLQGGDATPDGILRALSWQGLIGRKGR
ncbi:hypothetical protein [Streptomyces sp. BE230]|uniref:hypothetical protein n=1 Tax=Streptomyces sp. BE230 TaxID=3002526 RepID=UPI002ED3BC7D|nr:hypothetical protein [Streptomyces sp. BE230]